MKGIVINIYWLNILDNYVRQGKVNWLGWIGFRLFYMTNYVGNTICNLLKIGIWFHRFDFVELCIWDGWGAEILIKISVIIQICDKATII